LSRKFFKGVKMLKATLKSSSKKGVSQHFSKGGTASNVIIQTPLIQQKSKISQLIANSKNNSEKKSVLLQFSKLNLKENEEESVKIEKIKEWIKNHSGQFNSKEQGKTLFELNSAIGRWELGAENFSEILALFRELEGYGEIAQTPVTFG
jgi:hypothetical protein